MPRKDDPHPYIHRMRAMGMSDALIFQRLVLEGWASADMEPIFSARGMDVNAVSEIVPQEQNSAPARVRVKRLFTPTLFAVLAIGCIALAALLAAVYMYLRPAYVYSISIPSSASTTSGLSYGALPALSDPNYYESVKQNLKVQNVSFIDANLSSMRLTVYVNGTSTLEVPILAKGKVGSWWETPAGIYQIQTKEPNHLSSFGDVYMPFSMQFQGNFFVHGWPYYPDGTAVATSYSGGCIRLSTDDAKSVYDLVKVGLPILVYNAEPPGDSFGYQLKPPAVSASGYLIADMKNGTVLSSKNASTAAPIASITKLVAALVATEYINLDTMITVPREAIVYTSVPRLKVGESVRAYDLLFLLLQESSNEAAETLAWAYGRDQFIQHMNDKAHAINLAHTVFSDPSGAKGDYSTPEDLFTLLRYVYDNRRFIFGITTGELRDTAYGEPEFKNIQDFNNIPGTTLLGGKIGQTQDAGETYAGIFSARIGNQDRDIAIVVLGSQDSAADVKKLHDFVEKNYTPSS